MPTPVELATRLKEELKAAVLANDGEIKIQILTRIRDEFSWTEELEKRVGVINDLSSLTLQFPDRDAPDPAFVAFVSNVIDKLRRDKNEDTLSRVYERWWKDPPLPSGHSDNGVTVLFEDITAQRKPYVGDDVWQLEHVQANLEESFDSLFVRFRTQANKKHRHPYLPALSFDAVLADSTLLRISESGDVRVRDIVGKLTFHNPPKVPYIRNDDDPLTRREQHPLPIWTIMPWDRTLPSWFPPPPSEWLVPTPPPAYGRLLPTRGWVVETYKKVSILVFPGNGQNILPSITKPPLVASQIYLIVGIAPNDFSYLSTPDPDSDHVLPEHRFSPPVKLDQAQSLLGRAIQFSTEPLPVCDDEEPKTKRRRKETDDQKETKDIAYAWGLDPETMSLHCFKVNENRNFILDLTVRKSEAKPAPLKFNGPPPSPMTIAKKHIEWAGLVTLAEDIRVMTLQTVVPGISDESTSDKEQPEDEADQFYRCLVSTVKRVNASEASQLFELGDEGTLRFGDVQLAKDEGVDGFEAVVTGAKPGVWAVRAQEHEGTDRGILCLCWVNGGALEQEAISVNHDVASLTLAGDWELLATFSIDAGVAGIFSQHTFKDGGPLSSDGFDITSVLETLADFLSLGIDDDDSPNRASFFLVVPGGVVCSADDGGYDVLGKRDGSGLLTNVKVHF